MMRTPRYLFVAVPAVLLSWGAFSGDPFATASTATASEFEIGFSVEEVEKSKAKVRLTSVHGLPKNRYRAVRAESPIDGVLSFNIGMPPNLRAVRARCADVMRAYDLNPNDLSFKVRAHDAEGTLSFALPDLRAWQSMLEEAGIECS